jgi:phosphoglycolate phosphatase-like HAD superfamily hydrolase
VGSSSLVNAWIFDLDGTLADQTHRRHLAAEKKWEEYFWQCHKDTPIQDVIDMYNTLDDPLSRIKQEMIICSGRSSMVKESKVLWLESAQIYPDHIFMRAAGDKRPDWLVKQIIYDREIKGKFNVLGVFDDRDQVVQMWRKNGLRCYQVNYGNF